MKLTVFIVQDTGSTSIQAADSTAINGSITPTDKRYSHPHCSITEQHDLIHLAEQQITWVTGLLSLILLPGFLDFSSDHTHKHAHKC